MLTPGQRRYLERIPEGSIAHIEPYSTQAARFAEKLVADLEEESGLEVYWGGALALGILGSNDIDLTIFKDERGFEQVLPALAGVLGDPSVRGPDKVLWRTTLHGHKVDAYLGERSDLAVRHQVRFVETLRTRKNLLEEYLLLKQGCEGAPLREYHKRKMEFYNKVVGASPEDS